MVRPPRRTLRTSPSLVGSNCGLVPPNGAGTPVIDVSCACVCVSCPCATRTGCRTAESTTATQAVSVRSLRYDNGVASPELNILLIVMASNHFLVVEGNFGPGSVGA